MKTAFGTLLVGILPLSIGGCHSAFVYSTITNQGPAIRTVEIDYPSQSFGIEQLAPQQTTHFRFKVQGSGPIKLQFVDTAGKSHTSSGPTLNEASEGNLTITVNASGSVSWSTLIPRS